MEPNWKNCIFNSNKVLDHDCGCDYHKWLFKDRHCIDSDVNTVHTAFKGMSILLTAPECSRRLNFKTISPISPFFFERDKPAISNGLEVENSDLDDTVDSMWLVHKKRRLESDIIQIHSQSTVERPIQPPGMLRLARFLEVVTILGTAPWASMQFSVNESMLSRLIASHLPLIVGMEAWENEKASLYPIIDAHEDLSNTQNIVWITNRQQGKTSTLSKFLAAMSFMSPAGGNLFCVYSTNLDRAQEVTRAAKKYLYWIISEKEINSKIVALGLNVPVIKQDNERAYSVTGQYSNVINTVIARPKSPDSCRGDAPRAAIFDEIGFVSADFWYKFAYPLLQISQRVFTCATTPSPPGSFFSVFSEKIISRNADNDFFFRLINHSLVCPNCYEQNKADKCVHKLGLIPPWKSLLRFTQMKRLVPAKRMKDYEAEVFGVLQPEGSRYFPAKLVESVFIKRPLFEKNPFSGNMHDIFISIDPASHHRSYMGISAVVYGPEGQFIVMGLASVGVEKCEAIQVQMVCSSFVHRLAQHPWIRQRSLTTKFLVQPIVECNNNEILAQSILEAIKSASVSCRFITMNPFTKAHFGVDIRENLGVWTTDRNKLACIQQLYGAMLDGRVFVAKGACTVGEAFRAGNIPPSLNSQRELLSDQLKNFRDLPNGKVSGKDANTEDDMGMSLLMNAYWSYCIRASVASGNYKMGIEAP